MFAWEGSSRFTGIGISSAATGIMRIATFSLDKSSVQLLSDDNAYGKARHSPDLGVSNRFVRRGFSSEDS